MKNNNDSFFADPIDPRIEARELTKEVLCRLLLWMTTSFSISPMLRSRLGDTLTARLTRQVWLMQWFSHSDQESHFVAAKVAPS